MSKVIGFEPRVGKAQTDQTSGGFTVIIPKKKDAYYSPLSIKSHQGELQVQVRCWSVNPARLHLQIGAFSNPPLASELRSEK